MYRSLSLSLSLSLYIYIYIYIYPPPCLWHWRRVVLHLLVFHSGIPTGICQSFSDRVPWREVDYLWVISLSWAPEIQKPGKVDKHMVISPV